ncbi:DNA repair protein RadA [Candidatus Hydrogenosomobacter endosymbioticus]|nr:DNA repair protein RadA [Candidatus Hydrogenosomobacter endosymbioticus]
MRYVCQSCGSVYAKWKGKCDQCEQWNSLIAQNGEICSVEDSAYDHSITLSPVSSRTEAKIERITIGIDELDRVCGGGVVKGSVCLVSGDPGIGKSTLLLQMAAALSEKIPSAYISGEEGVTQIKMRAERLGVGASSVQLASSSNIRAIISAIKSMIKSEAGAQESKYKNSIPAFVVIDSIQTMASPRIDASAGTLSQVRECSNELVNFAKSTGVAVVLVGHITKEGLVAGPKVLEHVVDTVLYFEGERGNPYRLLRTVKNRFGPTDEIGVFDMTKDGLREVKNPSALFLSSRSSGSVGACVLACMEGSRPILVEMQALATKSFLASPRRAVVGWDSNRLSMILAVLEARCKINFSQKDVFLSVLGGLRIIEPGADLCAAFALVSCVKNRPFQNDAIAFGEIGLTGEIRPVAYADQRIKEAQKLGFKKVFMPFFKQKSQKLDFPLEVISINHVMQLIDHI